jgi:hypothetical protein
MIDRLCRERSRDRCGGHRLERVRGIHSMGISLILDEHRPEDLNPETVLRRDGSPDGYTDFGGRSDHQVRFITVTLSSGGREISSASLVCGCVPFGGTRRVRCLSPLGSVTRAPTRPSSLSGPGRAPGSAGSPPLSPLHPWNRYRWSHHRHSAELRPWTWCMDVTGSVEGALPGTD